MLPAGQASRRSWPQEKRPTSQAKPCRRDHNGSRRRRAYPTWGREAAEGARGVVRNLDLFLRWDSSLEFGWSQGHRETRHSYGRNAHSSTTSLEARSISRAAASIERVTWKGTERNVLSNSLSSSGEPIGAVSTRCKSFLRSTFRIRRGPIARIVLQLA